MHPPLNEVMCGQADRNAQDHFARDPCFNKTSNSLPYNMFLSSVNCTIPEAVPIVSWAHVERPSRWETPSAFVADPWAKVLVRTIGCNATHKRQGVHVRSVSTRSNRVYYFSSLGSNTQDDC
eukprot:6468875-Amphidinium_carterae.1